MILCGNYLRFVGQNYLKEELAKLQNNQLTIENILENDNIIEDLNKKNSKFISFFSNETIRKLIEYATRMPLSEDHNVGYKYPFKATQILCSQNEEIQDRIMNEIVLEESELYEEEKDNEGNNVEDLKDIKNEKKEQNQEKDESKEERALKFICGLNNAVIKDKEKRKKETEKFSVPSETNDEQKDKDGEKEEIKSEKKQQVKSSEETKKEQIKENDKQEKVKNKIGGEKDQYKHFTKEDEDNVYQKNKEDNEEKESDDNGKTVIIYDNIDYLFEFLKEKEEIRSNNVLFGYFVKIIEHLINSKPDKMIQYIFEYPKKHIFDILDAIVSNLNNIQMSIIINLLLLFSNDDLANKQLNLSIKILKELEICTEIDKCECICNIFAFTLKFQYFYKLFMSEPNLVHLFFSFMERTFENPKIHICIMNLFVKVNNIILSNFGIHLTENLKLWLYSDISFFLNENQNEVNNEEMDKINKNVLLALFKTLKNSEFKFLEDLGLYNQDNKDVLTTYKQKQKRMDMKKLVQIELFKTILDIFVNCNMSHFYEKEIEELIQIIKNKKIFYYCHKIFFDFPFCNIYQSYYNEIIEIVIEENSPYCLIECCIKYSDEKGERNLINDLMEHFFNNNKFVYNSSNTTLHPCSSFEISLLHKINNSKNENIKKLFENDDLKVFDKVLGEEINNLFLNEHFKPDEEIFYTFGKDSLIENIEEDIDIYNCYKEGKDYIIKLNKKIERQNEEREKMKTKDNDGENKDNNFHLDDNEKNEKDVEERGFDKAGEECKETNNGLENAEINEKTEKNIINDKNESQYEDKKSDSTEEKVEDKKDNDANN